MAVRRPVLVICLVAAVALGALPLSAAATQDGGETREITVTVTEDATLETIDVVWKIDAQSYSALYQVASEQGYDSVAEWYAADQLVPADNGYESYGAAADREGDVGYAIEVTFTEFDLEAFENTTLRSDGGTVTVELGNITDPAEEGGFGSATYVVEMPGEITQSNADAVDGNVATWHGGEGSPDALTVESGTEGADTEGAAGEDTIPGFGVGAGAVGAIVGVAVFRHRVG